MRLSCKFRFYIGILNQHWLVEQGRRPMTDFPATVAPKLLLLLFLTFSALVANPKKTTLHGGQSRAWSAEQGKKEEKKSLAAPPPPRARCSFGEKNKNKIKNHATHPHV